MSWTMKGFLNLLLFITIFKFVSNSNTGRTRIIEASDTNNSIESIYTSFNNSINSISNNTITHKTEFDTDLNHLVVDRNTGRVSFFPLKWDYVFICAVLCCHVICIDWGLFKHIFYFPFRYSLVAETDCINYHPTWKLLQQQIQAHEMIRKIAVSTNAHRT